MDIYQDSKCLALEKALDDESMDPIDLPFSVLKAITNHFADNQEIGRGGFGVVYKGVLPNGMVAVKKLLDKIEILEKNFQTEVGCLMEVKHENIVRFLGYCSETQHLMTLYEGKRVWADVRQRLFCFEYLSKGSLANYITDASSGLHWRERCQIIRGICEGVGFLHQQSIIHMDLKPHNILLDDSMVPKIADFGLSRRLSKNQSRTITDNIAGSWGYMAPEFSRSGLITLETDIYSVGVIIIEILTGSKEFANVDKVLESWMNTFGTSENHALLEQVKICAEIGINCRDDNPRNRPSIQDIISRLDESNISNSSVQSVTSTSLVDQLVDEMKSITRFFALSQEQSALAWFDQHNRLDKIACKPMRISASKAPGVTTTELSPGLSEAELLDVYPLELCFPFEANQRIHCSLTIINRTDRYVVCCIIPLIPDMYTPMDTTFLYPMSTAPLNMIMVEQEQPPLDAGLFWILMFTMPSVSNFEDLSSSIGNSLDGDDDKIGCLLNQVEKLGGEVHAARLTAVACPPKVIDNCQLSSASKIISRVEFKGMETIDVHPRKPWILVGADNDLFIWDYTKQETIVALDVQKEGGRLYNFTHINTEVKSARFIPRREWFVAGDSYGYIHVYTCLTMKEIKRFKASGRSCVASLAVHPTCTYLLSACYDGVVKLWDWDMGWACYRKFQVLAENPSGGCRVSVKFNPNDTDTFTSVDGNGVLIKAWSIYSSAPPITTIKQKTSWSGVYCDRINTHDYVFAKDGQNHVVVVAHEGLNIWDLQTGTCVQTLCYTGCFQNYTAVACHPTLPLIATGAESGYEPPAVHFWNSINYRFMLEKTFGGCTRGATIKYLGFVGSRRLVIGTSSGEIEILEIDMESLVCQQ